MSEQKNKLSQRLIYLYPLFISLFFLAATPIAVIYTKEWDFFDNLLRIITSPSKLVTDYFALGGLGSTLFNVAVCGLFTNLITYLSRAKANATILAGYMLVVAHCFYGLNFLNMWPPFFGIILYCMVTKKSISDNIHIAFFSTALAPFVSELCFRYAMENYSSSVININWVGVILSFVCGLAIGFIIPALLPERSGIHSGYSLYKAGMSIGILGIFLNAFMFNTLGVDKPVSTPIVNESYYALPYGYRGFMNLFYIILFAVTFIIGFILNKKSVHGYRELLQCTGHGTDFTDKFGMPVCMINIAIYGCAILAYLNLVFILPDIFPGLPTGVGFTGPTAGIVLAALTFAADGQHIKNVFPISVGYIAWFGLVVIICKIAGFDIPWTLSTQAYISSLAFATGLCPISGKYGFRYGVLAGFMSAIICTVTAEMHGGFVLYNGGFNAGLTALVIIPILDFYNVKPIRESDV